MEFICFSHLRWNFVYQRPQHLMSRFAKHFRLFFLEEPVYGTGDDYYEAIATPENVCVIVPHINATHPLNEKKRILSALLEEVKRFYRIEEYISWYYTPMALEWSQSFLRPVVTIYDCMDELSLFKDAPAGLVENEQNLLKIADLVFTGGYSLYESKKSQHPAVYPFPSSIDKKHFEKARSVVVEPGDQSAISHPRIGFFGVVDERFDFDLIENLSLLHPEWHFVIIGPVIKIDLAILPQAENIHYLGPKEYRQLPGYLAGWDAAMIPFALNESTRFISPTKTPEYLAGGIPVISTPIKDVVDTYAGSGLVRIAANADDFSREIKNAIEDKKNPNWHTAVSKFLDTISWDITFEKMMFTINTQLDSRKSIANKKENYV